MKMSLLRRYATVMELSSRMYPGSAPQLPLWVRHNNPRGVMVSHGDCRRQANWNRAQQGQRLFSAKASPLVTISDNAIDAFSLALNNLVKAVVPVAEEPKKILEALDNLKKFTEEKGYFDKEYKAKPLLSAVMSPLSKGQLHKHAGGLYDGVVKESLKVASLLLLNAPEKIRIKLYNYMEVGLRLKPILEWIRKNAADTEVIKLANEIYAKLPSTPK